MGKHSKVSPSTKWRLGENVVLQLMECLTPSVSLKYLWITISHLFVCLPTLELTTFENTCAQQKYVRKYTIVGDKQLHKKERAKFGQRTASKKAV